MRLNNNKILITGATEGIGEALLQKFLSLDNQIIAVGRNEIKLQAMAKQDKRVIPLVCDISKAEDLDELILIVEQQHPDTNILINNAGIQFNYHFAEESQLLGKIEQEINVNFLAPIKLIALILPTLNANKNAAIVNVSSGLGLVPKKQAPVYCGTKAGIHIFSKALRYQLETTKVFEIIPPLVDTRMTAGRGSGKITPEQLAEEFITAFRKDKFEVNIGKVKLLKLINRLSPALAEGIMKNGGEK
ncbi:SDR family NAD(P)-dependent oxidoreductase [Algoriphagus lacus]|uniref:SDR family NAD(P)-dependent oxidoreductase n=1 Tax=Algoriphagus lacus TaxID=2056311 RepID=A0A418PRQ0_9BACT|nr:SDR family NAD(P)-dependent oxidoreductase [Algoriphagus lacus]RIW15245.1 SDR family NAD(P)-dependent oxidoreductase [Algoriphagus lacus]